MRATIGANARPAKTSSSGAFSSRFQETTSECSCSAGNVASMRSSRSCQRSRVAAISSAASSSLAATISGAGRTSLPGAHAWSSSGLESCAASSSHSFNLFRIDSSMLIRSMPSV